MAMREGELRLPFFVFAVGWSRLVSFLTGWSNEDLNLPPYQRETDINELVTYAWFVANQTASRSPEMKIFTCFVPKKLLCSPKVKKLAKCAEIKVIKCKKVECFKPKYDCYKPVPKFDTFGA